MDSKQLDDLCVEAKVYRETAPPSPVKDLVTQLVKAVAFSQRGIKEALEALGRAEAEIQDLEADNLYFPVKVRLRANGELSLFSSDDGSLAGQLWEHLIENGYEPKGDGWDEWEVQGDL